MPKRGGGGSAFSNLRPGMIIAVKERRARATRFARAGDLGGMVAQEVSTGRVLAMQGGFAQSGANRSTAPPRRSGSRGPPSSRSSTQRRSTTE
jgi:penicillin-binding protein 1A